MIKTTYPDTKKLLKTITDKIDVKEIATMIAGNVQKRIDSGTNADGSKMTPLKPATIKVKQKKGGISPNKPLVFKGGTQKGIKSVRISKKEAHVVSTGMAKGYYGGGKGSIEVLKYQREKGRDPLNVSKEDIQDTTKLLRKQLGR